MIRITHRLTTDHKNRLESLNARFFVRVFETLEGIFDHPTLVQLLIQQTTPTNPLDGCREEVMRSSRPERHSAFHRLSRQLPCMLLRPLYGWLKRDSRVKQYWRLQTVAPNSNPLLEPFGGA